MTEINDKRPGLPNYTGPTEGPFGLVHHDRLWEYSHNILERLLAIDRDKSDQEIPIRRHNLIYLGAIKEVCAKCDPLYADYKAKCAPLDADYKAKRAQFYADYEAKRAQLDADYEAKRAQLYAEILAYIKSQISDCAWDGTELVFP